MKTFSALPLCSYNFRAFRSLCRIAIWVILFLLIGHPDVFSQDSLAVQKPVKRSPRKATLYSMVLPGLGQAYNRKYWKIPIIYTGFATVGYFGLTNRSEYLKFKEAYEFKVNGGIGDPPNDYATRYTADQLRTQRDYFRRNMEFNYILGGLIYILNMVDAAVDAHLSDFDISGDLSVRLAPIPVMQTPAPLPPASAAISLTWSF